MTTPGQLTDASKPQWYSFHFHSPYQNKMHVEDQSDVKNL